MVLVLTARAVTCILCVCRQITYIATSLAQLQDAERGERALDDQQEDDSAATTTSGSDSSSSSSSSVRAQQGRQSEQQQAVTELSRLLVLELCNAVQQCGSLLDAPGVANFVAAMGRLNHYDWQTMRYMGAIALRHIQVRGVRVFCPVWGRDAI
jgi:hypothetical protein